MAKYTAKLVADTSQHDAALGKSKQQVYNYQKGVEKSRKELDNFTGKIKGGAVSALSTFAVGIGAAVGVMETFNKIVKSNQNISDGWDKVMRTATNTVDNFFYSITTGDFSYFELGLDNIITKAKRAAEALDTLGNAKISYGYFNSKHGSELREQLVIAKDKTKSQTERDAALEKAKGIIAKQEQYTQSIGQDILNTISALATEKNHLQNVSIEQFEEIIALDLLPQDLRDKTKQSLQTQYKAYLAEKAKIEKEFTTETTLGTTSFGMALVNSTTDYSQVNAALNNRGIINKYQQAILYNELLVRMTDEQLSNISSLATEYGNNNRALSEMKTQILELTNQTVVSGDKARVALEGSIAAIEEQIANLQIEFKYATDTESRNRIQAEIDRLETQKVTIDIRFKPLGKIDMVGLPEIPALELPTKIEPIEISPIVTATENMMTLEQQAYSTASAVGAIGNMFSALGTLSSESGTKTLQVMGAVMGGIAEMIPQIVALMGAKQGEALASGTASAAKLPFPANLGAIATIVATLIGTFAQIKSITGFANGGIFTGSNTIGDMNLARVNSGEMILNGRQQAKLFRLINNNVTTTNTNNNSGNVQFKISGKDLVGILNTQNNRTLKVI